MRPSTLLFLFLTVFFCATQVLGYLDYPPTGKAIASLKEDVAWYEKAVYTQNEELFIRTFRVKNAYEMHREMERYRFKKLQVTTAAYVNTTMVIGKLRVTDAQGHADSVLHDIASVRAAYAKSSSGMKIIYIRRP